MFDTSDTGLRASQFHFSGNSKGNKSYRSVEDYVNSEAKRNYQQAIIQAVRDLYCQAEFDIEGVFEDDAITVDIAAERFFFDDRFDSDFREVCNLADLDPTRVRAGVVRMLEKFPETPPVDSIGKAFEHLNLRKECKRPPEAAERVRLLLDGARPKPDRPTQKVTHRVSPADYLRAREACAAAVENLEAAFRVWAATVKDSPEEKLAEKAQETAKNVVGRAEKFLSGIENLILNSEAE